MDKLLLLLVEDNPGDALLIKEYLSEKPGFPYEIAEAETLEEGLSLLAHYDFDIVLLDLSLPDSSGFETVRKVITNVPDIAVIVLTGLQDEEIALQSVRYGAQDYLEKQYLSSIMLYKSIIYSIERKKALQEKEDLFNDLTLALKKIESLEGILPLCISCKKILDEKQQWLNIEQYVASHSETEVIQLLCPGCKDDLDGESSP